MKNTLRARLIKWFSSRPNEVIASGDLQRMVSENTTYTPSNVSRRCRELVEDGIFKVTYKANHAHYQFNQVRS